MIGRRAQVVHLHGAFFLALLLVSTASGGQSIGTHARFPRHSSASTLRIGRIPAGSGGLLRLRGSCSGYYSGYHSNGTFEEGGDGAEGDAITTEDDGMDGGDSAQWGEHSGNAGGSGEGGAMALDSAGAEGQELNPVRDGEEEIAGEYLESSDSENVDEDGMPCNTNYTAENSGTLRGCRHYGRGCKIVSPCCDTEFWCRHCHNEEMDTGCSDPKKAHQIDRFAVKEVVCGSCNTRQPVAKECLSCGNNFGNYFCSLCCFFDDDDSKEIFHCLGCGICRVGGESNFFHCVFCGCCYALQLKDNHKCIAGAMHHNCPVCLDDLFHSTSQVRVLRCGHTLHKKCLDQLLRRPTALHVCPLCSKTLNDHSFTWHQLDVAVSQTPMPTEYLNTTVPILCNDCHTQGEVTFHVYGLKCPNELCGGYNTRRIMP